jgi:peptidoglycan/LPS O-acetylase OafA/YrhL
VSGVLVGLDGIRGLAALFVMLPPLLAAVLPGLPAGDRSLWSNWLIYGHFAVVIFIVLSGFSLAVSPARHRTGNSVGGKRFAHRRALADPAAVLAALAISLLIAWFVVAPAEHAGAGRQVVVVYGLLLRISSAPTRPTARSGPSRSRPSSTWCSRSC